MVPRMLDRSRLPKGAGSGAGAALLEDGGAGGLSLPLRMKRITRRRLKEKHGENHGISGVDIFVLSPNHAHPFIRRHDSTTTRSSSSSSGGGGINHHCVGIGEEVVHFLHILLVLVGGFVL